MSCITGVYFHLYNCEMISRSTWQLLRLPFSIFLMPVYWFSLSQTAHVNTPRAIFVFVILHLLIYPASNGYNSYMDRDTSSIGGIKNPLQPTKQLFIVTVLLDMVAILCSSIISTIFMLGIVAFVAASRAYSYRGIRLKKYPVAGYITVVIFQGALVFFLVMHGSSADKITQVPLLGMITASLLIGGFYPLTQVYQHEQDKEDGVLTLSRLLGYKGTFIFTAVVYFFAMVCLAILLTLNLRQQAFFIIQLFFLPVLAYFFWWYKQVAKNVNMANFSNTMRMNLIASTCTNLAFITLFLIEKI